MKWEIRLSLSAGGEVTYSVDADTQQDAERKARVMCAAEMGAVGETVLSKQVLYGIVDIPMDDYIADPCPEPALSKGVVLKLHERSPHHAWLDHPRLGGQRDNSSRADFGSGAHARLLGGDDRVVCCDATYASGPRKGEVVVDWTSRGGRKFQRDAWANGKIPLLQKESDQIEQMATVARTSLEKLGAGDTEQTIVWQDHGVWCKSRPDWMSADRDIVVDYKTTTNADPSTWVRRTLVAGGYDIQAALALRGLDIILGERQRQFLFLVQEITEPYACSWVGVSPELEDLAMRKISSAREVWRDCIKRNEWPGYSQDIYWADAPSWDMWDTEARELRKKGAS